jgi:hypothetical protein
MCLFMGSQNLFLINQKKQKIKYGSNEKKTPNLT